MGDVRGTYRVQVQPAFDLRAAAGLADYLSDLGATQLYSAPLLQSAPGSQHGYDVVDHSRVNTELGGADGLRALMEALRAKELGLVVDIVPNHAGVAVPEANPAWWDVLKNGRESDHARWFDIDWDRGPLLIPVLGSDADVSALTVEDGELRYYEHRYPLAPGTEGGSPQDVHDRQHYRLVDWRRGDAEITYRRFFAITDLAGLRVEDPTVFNATHGEILRWYAEGGLDGIRVDHPDGLRDPGEYLQRLRIGAPDAWLVVEKIAEPGEALPEWPIDGLTGYDALGEVGALFVDPAGEDAFTALDTEVTGVETDYPGLLYASKKDVATGMLRAELRRLARLASGVSATEPVVPEVEAALAELLAAFPVYRSYLPFGVDHLSQALAAAREKRPDLGPALDALEPRLADPDDELAIRFQQTSGAVMAKGAEDTAFYRWTRFVALNEVGGDPTKFGGSVSEWHTAARARQEIWPRGMTTLSTHDTKRSEDVRARLAVLSEIPDDWAAAVRRWRDVVPVPDGAIAHLLYQSVVATWPIDASRLKAAMQKSAREARTVTSWNDQNEEFEAALDAAVDAALASSDVTAFAQRITPYGWVNALGQKLVQLTMPGIPDTYQGTELWDNSLVDPDNRRPVDFDARRKLLARLDDGWLPPVDAEGTGGAVKLLITSRALRMRRDRPELFGSYTPVGVSGSAAEHAVAYDRGGAITVATRLPVGLERRGGWGDTVLALPDGDWKDALTGATYSAGADGPVGLVDILSRYPVALLTRA